MSLYTTGPLARVCVTVCEPQTHTRFKPSTTFPHHKICWTAVYCLTFTSYLESLKCTAASGITDYDLFMKAMASPTRDRTLVLALAATTMFIQNYRKYRIQRAESPQLNVLTLNSVIYYIKITTSVYFFLMVQRQDHSIKYMFTSKKIFSKHDIPTMGTISPK